jgi:4-amino-4-deoxy-L-arabinose transferase-like glycosyltransferase
MATDASVSRLRARPTLAARLAALEWPAAAWGAIGVTVLFLAITCWWLTQDSSIPIFDAGLHLSLVINVHRELAAGHLGTALTLTVPYPPLAYLVGSLGIMLGGVAVAPPILAENFVFVTLLALGCYKVGRLAFGPLAGLLAVVFALGSPLVSAQFHVFMTDAPETAMVAVSIWLIIATEGFSKLRMCAVAGVAVGLGMLTKEPFAIFVLGVFLVTLVRGGRGAWRGVAIFAAISLAIALPWYIHEHTLIQGLGDQATASSSAYPNPEGPGPKDIAPPRLSSANLEWYLWNLDNVQLGLPLLLFAAAGFIWAIVGFVRRRPVSRLAPELTIGAFLAWLILTETYFHDTRYSMPLLLYPAVFAAGGIVALPGRWRILATGALVLVVVANTLGSTFGVGMQYRIALPGASPTALEQSGYLTLYPGGFLVSGPHRDGDLLATLQALRHEGVRFIKWPPEEGAEPDFSNGGVSALSQIAQLESPAPGTPIEALGRSIAVLAHGKILPHEVPPCVTLDDGTGVWVRVGDPLARGAQDYCPFPRPHYYGPKQR